MEVITPSSLNSNVVVASSWYRILVPLAKQYTSSQICELSMSIVLPTKDAYCEVGVAKSSVFVMKFSIVFSLC